MKLSLLYEGLPPKRPVPPITTCGGCRAADEEGEHAKCAYHGLDRHKHDKEKENLPDYETIDKEIESRQIESPIKGSNTVSISYSPIDMQAIRIQAAALRQFSYHFDLIKRGAAKGTPQDCVEDAKKEWGKFLSDVEKQRYPGEKNSGIDLGMRWASIIPILLKQFSSSTPQQILDAYSGPHSKFLQRMINFYG